VASIDGVDTPSGNLPLYFYCVIIVLLSLANKFSPRQLLTGRINQSVNLYWLMSSRYKKTSRFMKCEPYNKAVDPGTHSYPERKLLSLR